MNATKRELLGIAQLLGVEASSRTKTAELARRIKLHLLARARVRRGPKGGAR